MNPKTDKKLNDVAVQPPDRHLELALREVGMENVQTQVRFQGLQLPARAQASVSLVDYKSRGIHMSRLFRILNGLHERELSWDWLHENLKSMLSTHSSLSDSAHMEIHFDYPVQRKALLSESQGWRNYPLSFRVDSVKGKLESRLKLSVLYSSTCPASASLTRQAVQEAFRAQFPSANPGGDEVFQWLGQPNSFIAFPHAQRSEARCEFWFDPSNAPSALSLIDVIEEALGTPVQTAVKREDEQEFARRNAQNLMFCEDAARRLKVALLKHSELQDFTIEVRHFESLHPHDVVAKVSKRD